MPAKRRTTPSRNGAAVSSAPSTTTVAADGVALTLNDKSQLFDLSSNPFDEDVTMSVPTKDSHHRHRRRSSDSTSHTLLSPERAPVGRMGGTVASSAPQQRHHAEETALSPAPLSSAAPAVVSLKRRDGACSAHTHAAHTSSVHAEYTSSARNADTCALGEANNALIIAASSQQRVPNHAKDNNNDDGDGTRPGGSSAISSDSATSPLCATRYATSLADATLQSLLAGDAVESVAESLLRVYKSSSTPTTCLCAILNMMAKMCGVAVVELDEARASAASEVAPVLEELYARILPTNNAHSVADVREFDSHHSHASDGSEEVIEVYMLSNKDAKYRRLRRCFEPFFESLTRVAFTMDVLLEETFLPLLARWLVAMSESKLRSFRHTATVALLGVVLGLNEVSAALAHRATQARARKELTALQQRRDRCEEWRVHLFTQAIHQRLRDVASEIRLAVFAEVKNWVLRFPAVYLENHFLRYFGMALHDKSAELRAEALDMILRALAHIPDAYARMYLFLQYFANRLVEMSSDVDVRCAELAIRVTAMIVRAETSSSNSNTSSDSHILAASESAASATTQEQEHGEGVRESQGGAPVRLMQNEMVDRVLLSLFDERPVIRTAAGVLLKVFIHCHTMSIRDDAEPLRNESDKPDRHSTPSVQASSLHPSHSPPPHEHSRNTHKQAVRTDQAHPNALSTGDGHTTQLRAATELLCAFAHTLRTDYGAVIPERYLVDALWDDTGASSSSSTAASATAMMPPQMLMHYEFILQQCVSTDSALRCVVGVELLTALSARARWGLRRGRTSSGSRTARGASVRNLRASDEPDEQAVRASDAAAEERTDDGGARCGGVAANRRGRGAAHTSTGSTLLTTSIATGGALCGNSGSGSSTAQEWLRELTLHLGECLVIVMRRFRGEAAVLQACAHALRTLDWSAFVTQHQSLQVTALLVELRQACETASATVTASESLTEWIAAWQSAVGSEHPARDEAQAQLRLLSKTVLHQWNECEGEYTTMQLRQRQEKQTHKQQPHGQSNLQQHDQHPEHEMQNRRRRVWGRLALVSALVPLHESWPQLLRTMGEHVQHAHNITWWPCEAATTAATTSNADTVHTNTAENRAGVQPHEQPQQTTFVSTLNNTDTAECAEQGDPTQCAIDARNEVVASSFMHVELLHLMLTTLMNTFLWRVGEMPVRAADSRSNASNHAARCDDRHEGAFQSATRDWVALLLSLLRIPTLVTALDGLTMRSWPLLSRARLQQQLMQQQQQQQQSAESSDENTRSLALAVQRSDLAVAHGDAVVGLYSTAYTHLCDICALEPVAYAANHTQESAPFRASSAETAYATVPVTVRDAVVQGLATLVHALSRGWQHAQECVRRLSRDGDRPAGEVHIVPHTHALLAARRRGVHLEATQMRVVMGAARLCLLGRWDAPSSGGILVQWTRTACKPVSDVFKSLFHALRNSSIFSKVHNNSSSANGASSETPNGVPATDAVAATLEQSILAEAYNRCVAVGAAPAAVEALYQTGLKLASLHFSATADRYYAVCPVVIGDALRFADSTDPLMLQAVTPYCNKLRVPDARRLLQHALMRYRVLSHAESNPYVRSFLTALRKAAKVAQATCDATAASVTTEASTANTLDNNKNNNKDNGTNNKSDAKGVDDEGRAAVGDATNDKSACAGTQSVQANRVSDGLCATASVRKRGRAIQGYTTLPEEEMLAEMLASTPPGLKTRGEQHENNRQSGNHNNMSGAVYASHAHTEQSSASSLDVTPTQSQRFSQDTLYHDGRGETAMMPLGSAASTLLSHGPSARAPRRARTAVNLAAIQEETMLPTSTNELDDECFICTEEFA